MDPQILDAALQQWRRPVIDKARGDWLRAVVSSRTFKVDEGTADEFDGEEGPDWFLFLVGFGFG